VHSLPNNYLNFNFRSNRSLPRFSAALPDVGVTSADLQVSQFDHIRDLRKYE
jgi:hypothetical protein